MENLQDINLMVMQDIQKVIGGRILHNNTEYYIVYRDLCAVIRESRQQQSCLMISVWKSCDIISEISLHEPDSIQQTIDILQNG